MTVVEEREGEKLFGAGVIPRMPPRKRKEIVSCVFSVGPVLEKTDSTKNNKGFFSVCLSGMF